MSKTAGIVIIGNEVLSGKTQDINSHFFCTELRQLGVDVQKISTIQDIIELIGEQVARFSKRFDFVFTSGGVGPTHDDASGH
jgi:molybdopterin-biosynthesis enzyme MoeA-like protein